MPVSPSAESTACEAFRLSSPCTSFRLNQNVKPFIPSAWDKCVWVLRLSWVSVGPSDWVKYQSMIPTSACELFRPSQVPMISQAETITYESFRLYQLPAHSLDSQVPVGPTYWVKYPLFLQTETSACESFSLNQVHESFRVNQMPLIHSNQMPASPSDRVMIYQVETIICESFRLCRMPADSLGSVKCMWVLQKLSQISVNPLEWIKCLRILYSESNACESFRMNQMPVNPSEWLKRFES